MELTASEYHDEIETYKEAFVKRPERFALYVWGRENIFPKLFDPGYVERFSQVVCGGRHTIALTATGKVYTWGTGKSGQLGHGAAVDEPSPRLVEAIAPYSMKKVECDGAQSAAVSECGKLFVWGWRDTPHTLLAPAMVEELSDFDVLDVAQGVFHILAVVNDADERRCVYAWGRNTYGQLGTGTTDDVDVPTRMTALDQLCVRSVHGTERSSAAITSDNAVFVWGYNKGCLLGTAKDDELLMRPTVVEGLSGEIVSFDCGRDCSAAITKSGEIYTWGKNSDGQLGHGSSSFDEIVSRPRAIKTLQCEFVVGVSIGHNFMTCWTKSSKMFSWGSNRDHRLGAGLFDGQAVVPSPQQMEAMCGRSVWAVSVASKSGIACVGRPMIGSNIEDTVRLDKITGEPTGVPGILTECAKVIKRFPEFVKLFDGDPQSSHKVCAMQQLWDAGYYVDMSSMNEPYTAALLLKVFLQRLPEPLFTTKLIPAIISLNTHAESIVFKVEGLRQFLQQIPLVNAQTLEELLLLLNCVYSNTLKNEISMSTLTNMFSGCILGPPSGSIVDLVGCMILNARALFAHEFPQMMSGLSESLKLNDGGVPVRKRQKELWGAFLHHWPSERLYRVQGRKVTFEQAILRSRAIRNSIGSALLYSPDSEGEKLFEELLSKTLVGINIRDAMSLMQAMSMAHLTADVRDTVAEMIAAYKKYGTSVALSADADEGGLRAPKQRPTSLRSPLQAPRHSAFILGESRGAGATINRVAEEQSQMIADMLKEVEKCALNVDQLLHNHQPVIESLRSLLSTTGKYDAILAHLEAERLKAVKAMELLERDSSMLASGGRTSIESDRLQIELEIEKRKSKIGEIDRTVEEHKERIRKCEQEREAFNESRTRLLQRQQDEQQGLTENLQRKRDKLLELEVSNGLFKKFFDDHYLPRVKVVAQESAQIRESVDRHEKAVLEDFFNYLKIALENFQLYRKKLKKLQRDEKKSSELAKQYVELKDDFLELEREVNEATATCASYLDTSLRDSSRDTIQRGTVERSIPNSVMSSIERMQVDIRSAILAIERRHFPDRFEEKQGSAMGSHGVGTPSTDNTLSNVSETWTEDVFDATDERVEDFEDDE